MFTRMLQRINPPNLEEAKKIEIRLAGQEAEMNNEQFIERHLMQLQYHVLPFREVSSKAEQGSASLKGLVSFSSKLAKCYESSSSQYNTLRALSVASSEFPGSLLDSLSSLDEYVRFLKCEEDAMTKFVKHTIAEPLQKLEGAHLVHTNAITSRYSQEVKMLNQAKTTLNQREKQLRQVQKLELNARRRCENFAQDRAQPSELGETELGQEMDFEMIHANWQKTLLQCRKQRDARDEAKSVLLTRTAMFNDVVAKLSLEAQVSEQYRVDAIKIRLNSLLEMEMAYLEQRKAVLLNTLLKVNSVDSVFDTRFFLHLSLIDRFLAGECETMNTSVTSLDPNLPSRTSSDSLNSQSVESPRDTESIASADFDQEKEMDFENQTETKLALEQYLEWIFTKEHFENKDGDGHSEERNGSSVPSPHNVGDICKMLDHSHNRAHVLRALNVFRSSQTLVQGGFDDLVVLVVALLDSCYVHRDVKVGKMTSIMTETFYHFVNDDHTEREYLQDRVKSHALWQSTYFWHEAFLFSVREEVEKNMKKSPTHLVNLLRQLKRQVASHEILQIREVSSTTSMVTIKDNPYELNSNHSAEVRESLHTYQQIVFCQIGSYSFNMLSFDIPTKRVKEFIKDMGSANCLRPEQVNILMENMSSRSLH